MALVVFLRGVNVGGHRTFRPNKLAEALKHLGAVNIGAAGTLVLRQPITQAQARAEVARRLPFVAEIVVCQGRDITSLISKNPFAGQSVRRGVVRFVSVLSRRPRLTPSAPMQFPSRGQWLLKILTVTMPCGWPGSVIGRTMPSWTPWIHCRQKIGSS